MPRHFARGNDITFEVRFYDVDDLPSVPSSANLYVAYDVSGVQQVDTLPLTSDQEGVFSATWDSSVADPGIVEWHARSSAPDKAAQDGSFVLIANDANPDPA